MDSLRVVIIDDNVEFAGLLGTLVAEQRMTPILAHTAAEGLSLVQRHQPRAVVLDLLLPDLLGRKLLPQLVRASPDSKFFVISGVFRGPEQREKIEAVHPISGWFEKPFDTRLLVEQIVGSADLPAVSRSDHRQITKLTVDLNPVEIERDEEPERAQTVLGAESADPELLQHDEFSGNMTPSPRQIAGALRTNLRMGYLDNTSVPALINAFYVAQETGELVFENGSIRRVIFFEQGIPIYTATNQPRDRMCYLVADLIDVPDDELRALSEALTDVEVGRVLVDNGVLSQKRLVEVHRAHDRRLIRDLFSWTVGRFVVGFQPTDLPRRTPLFGNPAVLLHQGIRERFTLERLRHLLEDSAILSFAPESLVPVDALPMEPPEARLLSQVSKRPAAIAKVLTQGWTLGLDEHATRAAVYGWLVLGIATARPAR